MAQKEPPAIPVEVKILVERETAEAEATRIAERVYDALATPDKYLLVMSKERVIEFSMEWRGERIQCEVMSGEQLTSAIIAHKRRHLDATFYADANSKIGQWQLGDTLQVVADTFYETSSGANAIERPPEKFNGIITSYQYSVATNQHATISLVVDETP